jgi:hypothetical protein
MTDTDKKNITDIKAYVQSLEQLDTLAFQKNKHLITLCFNKAIQIIESNAQAAYIASMEMIKERYPANADDIRPRQEDYNQA